MVAAAHITVHSLRSNETKQNDTGAGMVCIQQPSGNIRMSSYITNHLLKINTAQRKRARCGHCVGCTANDCGRCGNCMDKPKFGGPGKRKKACALRKCTQGKQNSYKIAM